MAALHEVGTTNPGRQYRPPTGPAHHQASPGLDSISIIGPSWAWRHGIRSLFDARLPRLSATCHEELTPPIAALPSNSGHVVLLDGAMDPALVLEWLAFIRRTNSAARVLVLDAANDTETLVAYFSAGIAGYTSLGDGETAIFAALESLQRGIAHCSHDLIAQLLATSEVTGSSDPLSPREREVLTHIARNQSNQQIADSLVVEVCTVKHHVHNILHKLDARNRWEAVTLATSRGWLDAT